MVTDQASQGLTVTKVFQWSLYDSYMSNRSTMNASECLALISNPGKEMPF